MGTFSKLSDVLKSPPVAGTQLALTEQSRPVYYV